MIEAKGDAKNIDIKLVDQEGKSPFPDNNPPPQPIAPLQFFDHRVRRELRVATRFDRVVELGGEVLMNTRVTRLDVDGGKITAGELLPFAGPVKDQAGEIKIPAGESAPEGMLLGMNWYVQGVDDTLPQ